MSSLDLHLHTTYSDGMLTPEAVVAEAAANGVTLLAITDHDDVGGIAPARAAAAGAGITVVSGVEINTDVGREDVHILGYGFAPESPVMQEGLHKLRAARLERLQAILARLAALHMPLDADRVLEIAGHGSVGRPHIARALLEAGYIGNLNEAFDKLIGHRGPAYIARPPFRPEEAIELIHRAGGIASLAHPGKIGDPIRLLGRLVPAGLDALEAYHTDHQPAVIARVLRLAQRFRLAVTGGSDSHGPGGPRTVAVGSVAIPDGVATAFRRLLQEKGASPP